MKSFSTYRLTIALIILLGITVCDTALAEQIHSDTTGVSAAPQLRNLRYDISDEEYDNLAGSKFRYMLTPSDYVWLSIGINGCIMNSAEFNRLVQLELTSGRYIGTENYIQVIARYGWGSLTPRSSLKGQIGNDLSVISAGIEFKSLYPSFYTSILQYFLAGLDINSYSFKYNTPLENVYCTPDGYEISENIYDDGVTAADIHAGIGFIVGQTPKTQICAELSPGYLIMAARTHEGADNEVLKNTFYIKLKLVLYFAYRKI